jgi:hypothetical protein
MTLCAVMLAASLVATEEKARLPEVTGVLATAVQFPPRSRGKVADACADLLASCSHSAAATEEKWFEALRACHVHIKFPVARAVAVSGEKVMVSEMVVTFPLTSTGYIVVRTQDTFSYCSKFTPRLCENVQESLKHATAVKMHP